MLQALNTGHDGSLSTVHANSAVDALARLETLVLLADIGLPLAAIRAQLVAALDAVVFVARRRAARAAWRAIAELSRLPTAPRCVRSFSRGCTGVSSSGRHAVACATPARRAAVPDDERSRATVITVAVGVSWPCSSVLRRARAEAGRSGPPPRVATPLAHCPRVREPARSARSPTPRSTSSPKRPVSSWIAAVLGAAISPGCVAPGLAVAAALGAVGAGPIALAGWRGRRAGAASSPRSPAGSSRSRPALRGGAASRGRRRDRRSAMAHSRPTSAVCAPAPRSAPASPMRSRPGRRAAARVGASGVPARWLWPHRRWTGRRCARRARGVTARAAGRCAEARALSAQARVSAIVVGVAPSAYLVLSALVDPARSIVLVAATRVVSASSLGLVLEVSGSPVDAPHRRTEDTRMSLLILAPRVSAGAPWPRHRSPATHGRSGVMLAFGVAMPRPPSGCHFTCALRRASIGRWTGPIGRVGRRAVGGDTGRSPRRARSARELPVVIDLLAVAVGAGCTPYLAVGVASSGRRPQWPGASIESAATARSVAGSATRSTPLPATLPVLHPLCDALLASERYGAPVGDALSRLATEERPALRRRAEARAGTVPVRLLFPLVFLVLPAFGLLTVVPVLLAGLSSPDQSQDQGGLMCTCSNGPVAARSLMLNEAGQTTAEYALVILGAAVVAGGLAIWAKGGAIRHLFDPSSARSCSGRVPDPRARPGHGRVRASCFPCWCSRSLAVLQVALVVRDHVAVVHAAREAARAASVDPDPSRAVRVAHATLPGAHVHVGPRPASASRSPSRSRTSRTPTLPLVGPLFPDPTLAVTRRDAGREVSARRREHVGRHGRRARRRRRCVRCGGRVGPPPSRVHGPTPPPTRRRSRRPTCSRSAGAGAGSERCSRHRARQRRPARAVHLRRPLRDRDASRVAIARLGRRGRERAGRDPRGVWRQPRTPEIRAVSCRRCRCRRSRRTACRAGADHQVGAATRCRPGS